MCTDISLLRQDVAESIYKQQPAPPELILSCINLGLPNVFQLLSKNCDLEAADVMDQGLLGNAARSGRIEMLNMVCMLTIL